MKMLFILVGAALLLVACEQVDPLTSACVDSIKKALKAPASFKLVSTLASGPGADKYGDVYIKFDAQNGYGALIRGQAHCRLKDNMVLVLSIDGKSVPQL